MIPFIFVAICFCRVMFYLSQKKTMILIFRDFQRMTEIVENSLNVKLSLLFDQFFSESHDFFQTLKFFTWEEDEKWLVRSLESIFQDYFQPLIALESAAEYTDTEHVGTTRARQYSSTSPGWYAGSAAI